MICRFLLRLEISKVFIHSWIVLFDLHEIDGASDGDDAAVWRDDQRVRSAVVVRAFVLRAVVLPVVVSFRIVHQFPKRLRPARVRKVPLQLKLKQMSFEVGFIDIIKIFQIHI